MKNLTRIALAMTVLCIGASSEAAHPKKTGEKRKLPYKKYPYKPSRSTEKSRTPGARLASPRPVMRMDPIEIKGDPNAPEATIINAE